MIYTSLREDFGIAEAAVRLWGMQTEDFDLLELSATSEELQDYVQALGEPYCGPDSAGDSQSWFADAARLRSFAYVPLRSDRAFGLLALASDDASRFYPEMGTLYLSRFGQVASVALQRFFRKDA